LIHNSNKTDQKDIVNSFEKKDGRKDKKRRKGRRKMEGGMMISMPSGESGIFKNFRF